jgi:hypothetical protein
MDNYGTHTHTKVQAWLKRHPRFVAHLVPTSSSWLIKPGGALVWRIDEQENAPGFLHQRRRIRESYWGILGGRE